MIARASCIVAVGLGTVAGMGCRQFAQHRRQLQSLHARGQYEQAAELLDETRDTLYANEMLLWRLDRGAVALANDKPDAAIEYLNTAERMIDTKREKRPDEIVATWLVSERSAPYIAEPYEDMYVNVLKLLAQLEAGRIAGYATVEARRLAWKADHLRDLHHALDHALDDEAHERIKGDVPRYEGAQQGEFIESPLGTYLSAIAFMEAGEGSFQQVAADRLVDAIRREGDLIGDVEASGFDELDDLTPEDADLLAVALSGRGPTKVPRRIGPIIVYTVPVYFELPELEAHPSEVAGAVLEIQGHDDVQLKLVENLARVAEANHARRMDLIYTRTMLRAAAKAVGAGVLAEVARENDNPAGVLLAVLGGLAYMAVTERADLRSWIFLPGEARVAVADLAPGTYDVRVVYTGEAGGTLYTTPWRTVTIGERGLKTLVTHYWR